MATIWKWPVDMDQARITVPADTKFLSAGMQNNILCLWGLVPDPAAEPVVREMRVVGTGHEFDLGVLKFIDTFQLAGGQLIFHVWAQQ